MTEDVFATADPETLKGNAIKQLEEITEDFTNNKIDSVGLYMSARNIWGNINRNPVLREKIDEALKLQRLAVRQVAVIDISKGDPIRKRYDPDEWLKSIPPELMNKKNVYFQDKVKSLLNLFRSIS